MQRNLAKRPVKKPLLPASRRVPRQAELFADIEVRQTPAVPLRKSRSEHLWLCVHFKSLALEVLESEAGRPQAVTTSCGNKTLILMANVVACEQGIAAGMPVNSALALLPELQLHERDERLENEALQSLAVWAVGFTPVVSVTGASGLLLEVRGSLQLFGGLRGLLSQMQDELYDHEVCFASAPVPQAAIWMATAGGDLHIRDVADAELKSLPVAVLNWPDKLQQQFVRMGIATLGDCLRLPRDGFARRFGPERLLELDKGFGRMPDLRLHYAEPVLFDDLYEFDEETSDYDLLLNVLDLQLEKLRTFLRQRQFAVEHLRIRLLQRGGAGTEIEIGLLEPQHQMQGVRELVRLRFERLYLDSPVESVILEATSFAAAELSSEKHSAAGGLAGDQTDTDSGAGARLVERLRARLGMERVYGIGVVPDHRPERAWLKANPAGRKNHGADNQAQPSRIAEPGVTSLLRPLWMLDKPVPVAGRFTGEPERIESGWWDGDDVQRDYYVVNHDSGQRVWVFRDKRGWYLHGLFG